MAKVNEDMIISDVLAMDNNTVGIFFEHGLHCLGCMYSTAESLKDACAVHGLDVQSLVDDLNSYLDKQEAQG